MHTAIMLTQEVGLAEFMLEPTLPRLYRMNFMISRSKNNIGRDEPNISFYPILVPRITKHPMIVTKPK